MKRRLLLGRGEKGVTLVELLISVVLIGILAFIGMYLLETDVKVRKLEHISSSRGEYYDTLINRYLARSLVYIKDGLLDATFTLDRDNEASGGHSDFQTNPSRVRISAGNSRRSFLVPDSFNLERFRFNPATLDKETKGFIISRCVDSSKVKSEVYSKMKNRVQLLRYLNGPEVRVPIIKIFGSTKKLSCCPRNNINCSNDLYDIENGGERSDRWKPMSFLIRANVNNATREFEDIKGISVYPAESDKLDVKGFGFFLEIEEDLGKIRTFNLNIVMIRKGIPNILNKKSAINFLYSFTQLAGVSQNDITQHSPLKFPVNN